MSLFGYSENLRDFLYEDFRTKVVGQHWRRGKI